MTVTPHSVSNFAGLCRGSASESLAVRLHVPTSALPPGCNPIETEHPSTHTTSYAGRTALCPAKFLELFGRSAARRVASQLTELVQQPPNGLEHPLFVSYASPRPEYTPETVHGDPGETHSAAVYVPEPEDSAVLVPPACRPLALPYGEASSEHLTVPASERSSSTADGAAAAPPAGSDDDEPRDEDALDWEQYILVLNHGARHLLTSPKEVTLGSVRAPGATVALRFRSPRLPPSQRAGPRCLSAGAQQPQRTSSGSTCAPQEEHTGSKPRCRSAVAQHAERPRSRRPRRRIASCRAAAPRSTGRQGDSASRCLGNEWGAQETLIKSMTAFLAERADARSSAGEAGAAAVDASSASIGASAESRPLAQPDMVALGDHILLEAIDRSTQQSVSVPLRFEAFLLASPARSQPPAAGARGPHGGSSRRLAPHAAWQVAEQGSCHTHERSRKAARTAQPQPAAARAGGPVAGAPAKPGIRRAFSARTRGSVQVADAQPQAPQEQARALQSARVATDGPSNRHSQVRKPRAASASPLLSAGQQSQVQSVEAADAHTPASAAGPGFPGSTTAERERAGSAPHCLKPARLHNSMSGASFSAELRSARSRIGSARSARLSRLLPAHAEPREVTACASKAGVHPEPSTPGVRAAVSKRGQPAVEMVEGAGYARVLLSAASELDSATEPLPRQGADRQDEDAAQQAHRIRQHVLRPFQPRQHACDQPSVMLKHGRESYTSAIDPHALDCQVRRYLAHVHDAKRGWSSSAMVRRIAERRWLDTTMHAYALADAKKLAGARVSAASGEFLHMPDAGVPPCLLSDPASAITTTPAAWQGAWDGSSVETTFSDGHSNSNGLFLQGLHW